MAGLPQQETVLVAEAGERVIKRRTHAVSAGVIHAQQHGLAAGARGLQSRCEPGGLRATYPDAEVPIVQLGLDTLKPGAWHDTFARRVAFLRDEGVPVPTSGNIARSLPLLRRYRNAPAPPE